MLTLELFKMSKSIVSQSDIFQINEQKHYLLKLGVHFDRRVLF